MAHRRKPQIGQVRTLPCYNASSFVFSHRWRFIVHGAIDDSRGLLYTYGAPLTTKVIDTVLALFHNAVLEFGLPARCRSDKGGENVKVHNSMWPIYLYIITMWIHLLPLKYSSIHNTVRLHYKPTLQICNALKLTQFSVATAVLTFSLYSSPLEIMCF